MSKNRKAAEAQLRGLLLILENNTKKPPAQVLATAQQVASDALRVLMEPDPMMARILFVFTAIKQSTEVKPYTRNGKTVKLTRITDPDLYHWAMEQVHTIAAELAA